MLLLGAAQLAAALSKQQQEKSYKEQQYQDEVMSNRRSAIERSLKKPSYLRQPDPTRPLDTTMLDTIGGVAQAGQAVNWKAMGA
jgi:hypothetical protein